MKEGVIKIVKKETMRKIRLNESDLQRIIKRTINESQLLNEDWVDVCCDKWGHSRCCQIKDDRDANIIHSGNGDIGRKRLRN